MSPTAVIALGSGALLRPSQRGAAEEQRENLHVTCQSLVGLVAEGYRLVLTHGNGIQVGNILLQNVQSRSLVPAMPLDVCGAQSQGQIGYMIQNALESALARAGLRRPVACLLTRALVDAADPTFEEPRKAVGPVYTPTKAMDLMRKGLTLREGPRGWRQVVASPDPKAVLEAPLIQTLLAQGAVVIAGGGGGIPVVMDRGGTLLGVEAVVEKDLTAGRLATELRADLLVLATDVPKLRVKDDRTVDRLTPGEARRLVAEGCFPEGSMAPKVTAAHRFVEETGGRALITTIEQLPEALLGTAGTHICA